LAVLADDNREPVHVWNHGFFKFIEFGDPNHGITTTLILSADPEAWADGLSVEVAAKQHVKFKESDSGLSSGDLFGYLDTSPPWVYMNRIEVLLDGKMRLTVERTPSLTYRDYSSINLPYVPRTVRVRTFLTSGISTEREIQIGPTVRQAAQAAPDLRVAPAISRRAAAWYPDLRIPADGKPTNQAAIRMKSSRPSHEGFWETHNYWATCLSSKELGPIQEARFHVDLDFNQIKSNPRLLAFKQMRFPARARIRFSEPTYVVSASFVHAPSLGDQLVGLDVVATYECVTTLDKTVKVKKRFRIDKPPQGHQGIGP